jgi:hypothetical protein
MIWEIFSQRRKILFFRKIKSIRPVRSLGSNLYLKNYSERFLNDFQAKVFGQKHLPEKRQRVYLGVGVLGKEIGYQMEY